MRFGLSRLQNSSFVFLKTKITKSDPSEPRSRKTFSQISGVSTSLCTSSSATISIIFVAPTASTYQFCFHMFTSPAACVHNSHTTSLGAHHIQTHLPSSHTKQNSAAVPPGRHFRFSFRALGETASAGTALCEGGGGGVDPDAAGKTLFLFRLRLTVRGLPRCQAPPV